MHQFVRRMGLVLCVVLLQAGLAHAAPLKTITVTASGETIIGGALARNALQVETDQETILIPLQDYLASSNETADHWILELPVIMGFDWRPELIPGRCNCQVSIERLTEQKYDLKYSGLTRGGEVILRADFPAGTFVLPAGQAFWLNISRSSPWLLGIAILLFIGSLSMLGWMIREIAAFRKFKIAPKIISQPPNELSPTMVSMLPSGKIAPTTMAAMLIDLGRRNYLTIINKGETFLLAEDRHLDLSGPGFSLGAVPGEIPINERKKAKKEGVTIAEKFLLAKLFTEGNPVVSREELKTRIGRHLESAKIGKVYAEVYQEATDHGFFITNPHLVHLRYRMIGIGIFFAGLVGMVLTLIFDSNASWLPVVWIVISLSGYVVTRMVPHLPLLTVTGQAELIRWAGFRAYLANPNPLSSKIPTSQFFEYLPYALAWGVLADWSKRFRERTVKAPSWYLTAPTTQPVTLMAAEVGHLTTFVSTLLAAIHEHTRR